MTIYGGVPQIRQLNALNRDPDIIVGFPGRAEREGIACTFVTSDDHNWLHATERMIGKPIERRQVVAVPATAGRRRRTAKALHPVDGQVLRLKARTVVRAFDVPDFRTSKNMTGFVPYFRVMR